MASHLSNVNMLMKVAEESEKDTPSIIGHDMTGRITDVSMRYAQYNFFVVHVKYTETSMEWA